MKYIAIHHTAVENVDKPQLYAVNRYHKEKWNMKSSLGYYVGYNYFIDTDGIITQTRAHDEETIANKGHNCDIPERCDTISICIADNFNKSDGMYYMQQFPLSDLIQRLQCQYKNTLTVVGHRDLQQNRTCPGANLTKKDLDQFDMIVCKKTNNDLADDNKEAQITLLQAKLDSARKAIARLIKRINDRNYA